MDSKYQIKIILHSKLDKGEFFLKLFNMRKKIEGNEVTFQFSEKKFNKFQFSLPTPLYIINSFGTILKNYTLNLIRGTNNYHLISYNYTCLFECIFYKEDNLRIFINNEEIKEYDECSNFKRFSFINIDKNNLTINETIIRLYQYIPICKGNSYQCSFYDIKNEYIVTKRIFPIKKMNFPVFYEKKIKNLEEFSAEIETIKKDDVNFKENITELFYLYQNIYIKITKKLNLRLPKDELEQILNEENYIIFFYYYAKLRLFFLFMCGENKNKDISSFINLYNYFEHIYLQLQKEVDFKIYEKITILLSFAALFEKFNSYEEFSKSNFHYIKVTRAEKNSIINLAMTFLNDYINNLNEESPSFFKLIEIDSGFGFYNNTDNTNDKLFTFDMIDLFHLKKHLRETLPAVISFFSHENSNNMANTEMTIGGININETKLLNQNEKVNFDLADSNTKDNTKKDIAMKLVENLMHESFGHSKFQLHSKFSSPILCETPKKCFDNKTLKTLVGLENNNNEKETINILHDNKKSDSGNYFESSFGKCEGYNVYTFTLLECLKSPGKLLDHPEFFYNKEYLDKLQIYVLYNFIHQNNNQINQEEADDLNMNSGTIELEEKMEKPIENESIKNLDNLSFEEELDYLIKIYSHDYPIENSEIFDKKDLTEMIPKFVSKDTTFLGHKRFGPKNNNEIQSFNIKNRPIKKRKKHNKSYSRKTLLTKLSKYNMSNELRKYYFDLYLKTTLKD